PSTGIVATGLIGHRDSRIYGYDREEPTRLVEEGDHECVELEIATQYATEFLAAAQVIASNLSEIGQEVSVTPLDSGTFWSLGFEGSPTMMTNQLILNRFTMAPDPSWATEWFTPRQVGIWNWEHFDNEEFGRLNDEGLRET